MGTRIMRFRSDLVAATAFGLLVGAVVVMTAEGLSHETSPAAIPRVRSSTPVKPSKTAPPTSRVLLAWAPGGLPSGAATRVATVPGIERVTTVVAGMDWLPARRPGYEIPFEPAAVEPRRYAALVPRGEAAALQSLRAGEIVLAATTARSLSLEPGDRVRSRSGRYLVTGIVSDVTAMGYEGLVATVPGSWTRRDAYVLAQLGDDNVAAVAETVRARLEALLPAGTRLRVRAEGETPYLRYGDAVLPLLEIKEAFGTFALRLTSGGSFEPDPVWKRNIVARRVPLIGRVVCHRALLAQLTGALRELRSEGLGHTVNPGDFGGCWSPRFIGRNPSGQLSHHAWGIAIDLNASANAFGTKSDQDDRLVETMERWGFTWGGRWLIPDPMHFEWARFPD